VHAGRPFLCVDTGGFSAEPPRDPRALAALVRAHTLRAIEDADCVVCVFDGQAGLAPEDRETVRLLRRTGKPTVFVVNKIDTARHESMLHDFRATGADPLLAASAAHGLGLAALIDAVLARLPPPVHPPADEPPASRLAIVGRPNVGKSSLLNRLLGAERVIVAAEPGTTRDAIDTPVAVDGQRYVLIDTAGIRRRGRTREPLERHGAVRALGTLTRSDLVLVVLDAREGMTDQDARLVGRAWEAGRGIALVANKWDAVPAEGRDRAAFRRALADAYPAFANLPVLCVSALTGEGLADLFPLVARLERAYGRALPTPALNRALRTAVAAHPPPSVRGRPVRLLYATQTARCPPTVRIFATAPEALPRAYVRHLTARLSETFGLVGVPLRLQLVRRPTARPPRDSAGRARRSSRPTRADARPRRR
jgi:GTP-binding protein